MRQLKSWLRVVALLAVIALVAAACGGDDSSDTTAPPSDDGTTTTTEAPDDGDTTTTSMADTMTGLSGLNVVDDLTFTVELNSADAEFPLQLSYAAYYPLPSVFYDDPIGFEESPIGNGPFRMDGVWENDVQINLVPYEDYQGVDPADVGSLSFQIYESVDTAFLELRAGNLDVIDSIPLDQIATAPDEFGDRYAETPSGVLYYYGIPTYLWDQYPLDVRRALSMAIDRQLVIDAILNGTRQAATSAIPASIAGSRDFVCDNWTYNPDMAAEVWNSIDNPPEDLIVWFNSGSNHDQIAEAVVNQWAQNLGIDPSRVSFEQLEFSEYLPLLDNAGMTGIFRLGWGQDYPSPLNFLEPLYASYNIPPVGSNNTNYENPDFDALIAEGKAAIAATGDLNDGIPFYQQAEDLLCADVNIIPIYYGKNQFAWGPDVDNVTVDAFSDPNFASITGDELRVFIVEPEHLNPLTSNESEGIKVLRTLFSPLVDYDPFTGEPFNEVAESITSDDNGKTWTITLKDGYTFHNGEPVTAQSFVDAWNYGADGANAQQNNSFYFNIVGYDELNPS